MKKQMKRSIRLDDFPHGGKLRFNINDRYLYLEDRVNLKKVLKIFELYGINYILGASPFLMNEEDIEFLKENVNCGKVVMHGFDHGFDTIKPWPRSLEQWDPVWAAGGEFAQMSQDVISEKYDLCRNILLQTKCYDKDDFVAPFNAITQNLLDVLDKKDVKRIHLCDKEWRKYGYDQLNFYKMQPVISPYLKTYDFANKVLAYIMTHPDDNSQITLHWIFDTKHNGWEGWYHNLCHELIRTDNTYFCNR